MTDYRRRVLRQHFVRAMAHARAQFEALISERDYWKDKARELEDALTHTTRELDCARREADAAHRLTSNTERVRDAQSSLILLLETRVAELERDQHHAPIFGYPARPVRLH